MGDMREVFDMMKQRDRERKAANLARHESRAQTIQWKRHTDLHWSTTLNGKRLDFWPSRNKFQYEGRVMTGDVYGFIKNRTKA